MNKEKEEMLARLRNVRDMEMAKLEENGLKDKIQIDDVKYLGKATIIQEIDGKEEEIEINVYAVIEGKTIKYYSDDMCLGFETKDVGKDEPGIIASPEIVEIIEKLKEQEIEEQEKPEEEKTTISLNELEEEKKEEKGVEKVKKPEETPNKEGDQKKKRKPSYVIETINPDKAKMDYWQTIKKAFGLPAKVATLAFAYPVSSEDKVDDANITVYMLDKDGNIIDDLDVDDYFKFDTSTGNNPMQDNKKTHEEDENKGKAQIDGQYTMIRLKAINARADKNTYISLEQKNSFGDYNDINAGRKPVAGTQNVEKQLETDHVRVWDSEVELLMRSNSGVYHMNDILKESEKHADEHGDEGYIHTENADGNADTKRVCQKNIYMLHQCLIQLKEKEQISKKLSDEEIIYKLIEIIDKNPNITKDELIKKAEEDIIGDEEQGDGKETKEVEKPEPTTKSPEKIREGPWDLYT